MQGQINQAKELLWSSIERAEEWSLHYRAGWGRVQLAHMLALGGDLKTALSLIETSLGRDPEYAADALAHERLAVCRWLAGDLEDAVAQVEASFTRRAMVGSLRRAWAAALAARLYGERGDHLRARRHLELAAQTYREGEVLTWGVWWPWADGVLAWQVGRFQESHQHLEQALEKVQALQAPCLESLILIDALELARTVGSLTDLTCWAERLEAVVEMTDAPLARWLSELGGALASLGSGDHDRAAFRAKDAATQLGAAGYRFHAAIAMEVLGQAHEPEDKEACLRALQEAAEMFDRAGASWRRDRVVERLQLISRRGQRIARAIQGPGSLTAREWEVARLAAQGLTAPEIGEALYISRRTVESHLAHLYPKLGVRSKRELVRRAEELGLDAVPSQDP